MASLLGPVRALSGKVRIVPPKPAAKGDTRFVIERRAWRQAVHALRKRYQGEVAAARSAAAEDRAAAVEAKAAADELRAEERRARVEAHDERRRELKRQADAERAELKRRTALQALETDARRRAEAAAAVAALARDSAGWIDAEGVEPRITAGILAGVRSPVNDEPDARRPRPEEGELSGAAADAALLQDLARAPAADVPVWLRHSLVGTAREAVDEGRGTGAGGTRKSGDGP